MEKGPADQAPGRKQRVSDSVDDSALA